MTSEMIQRRRDLETALHEAALAARVAIDNLKTHAEAIGMDVDDVVERFQALIFEGDNT